METWKYKKITIYALCILLILNLSDAAITVYGLSTGIFKEQNPIVRNALEDPMVFYMIKVVLATLSIAFCIYSIDTTRDIKHNTMKGITYVVLTIMFGYLAIVTWAASIFVLTIW